MSWLRHTFTEKLAAVKQNIIADFFLLFPQLGSKVDDSPLLNCHFLGYNNNVTIFQIPALFFFFFCFKLAVGSKVI